MCLSIYPRVCEGLLSCGDAYHGDDVTASKCEEESKEQFGLIKIPASDRVFKSLETCIDDAETKRSQSALLEPEPDNTRVDA